MAYRSPGGRIERQVVDVVQRRGQQVGGDLDVVDVRAEGVVDVLAGDRVDLDQHVHLGHGRLAAVDAPHLARGRVKGDAVHVGDADRAELAVHGVRAAGDGGGPGGEDAARQVEGAQLVGVGGVERAIVRAPDHGLAALGAQGADVRHGPRFAVHHPQIVHVVGAVAVGDGVAHRAQLRGQRPLEVAHVDRHRHAGRVVDGDLELENGADQHAVAVAGRPESWGRCRWRRR